MYNNWNISVENTMYLCCIKLYSRAFISMRCGKNDIQIVYWQKREIFLSASFGF